jgi:XTP/dITP diphosphohydrolase
MIIEQIVLATRNPGKIAQYQQTLQSLGIRVLGLEDLRITGKPIESGKTAQDNAQIKAAFYSELTPLPVLSEDESLFVDFLPPHLQPGVFVRRINGQDEVTDDQLLAYWSEIIARTPPELRTGRWHFAYCLAYNGVSKIAARDVEIRFFHPPSPIRIPGWPLSSLQGSTGKPSCERTDQEKQKAMVRDGILIRGIIQDLVGQISD